MKDFKFYKMWKFFKYNETFVFNDISEIGPKCPNFQTETIFKQNKFSKLDYISKIHYKLDYISEIDKTSKT